MQRRVFERVTASINVRLFSGETESSGTVKNLSEKGMFISTELGFPLAPQLKILFFLEKGVLHLPVNVRSLNKSSEIYNGIGVELTNPPQDYIEFVSSLRTAL
jgi:hypothetical protein